MYTDAEFRLATERNLKYQGTDSSLVVSFDAYAQMRAEFEASHQKRYGFSISDKPLVVELIALELVCETQAATEKINTGM